MKPLDPMDDPRMGITMEWIPPLPGPSFIQRLRLAWLDFLVWHRRAW